MALGPGGNRVVEVRIGAALDSGFRRSFGSAADSARQFGTAVKALDMQARQVAGLERQQQAVNAARLAWGRAETQVRTLATSFGNAVQPTKRQASALALAEAAAGKAAAKVKALDAALAAPPVSAKRAQELARAEAAATAAKTRVDALNAAMATPPAPSTKQVEQLGRLREQAGAATERVRALEATLAKGGHWGAGAAKLRGELEKARDRAAALEAKARDLGAAMSATRAPTEAQARSLARAQAQAEGTARRVEDLRAAMTKAGPATARQTAAIEKARQEHQQAAAKVEALNKAIAATAGPSKAQAAAFERARETARRAKDAFQAQSDALERSRRAASAAGVDLRNLSGEARRVGDAYRHASTQMARLNAVAEQRRALGDAARDLAVAGAAAYGAVRPMVAATRNFASFEHGLARFKTVAGLTTEGVARLRQEVLGLSDASKTNQRPEALLEGLGTLVGKGMDAGVAQQLIEPIGRAATATGATMEDLSNSVFSLWQNMGIGPAQMRTALDGMAQAAVDGGFELKNMARHFPMLTAQAQALGITGQSGVASLAAMLQVGLRTAGSPDEAANNLNNVFGALLSPETQNNYSKLGVDIGAQMRDARERGINPIERVIAITEKLTNGGDLQLLGKLIQDRQARTGMLGLIQNIRDKEDGSRGYLSIRNRAFRPDAVVDESFATMMETLRERLNAAGIAVWRFGEVIGKAILPVVTPLVSGFTGIVSGLTALAERFPIATGVIATAGTALAVLAPAAAAVHLAVVAWRFGAAWLGLSRLGAAAMWAGRTAMPLLGAALPVVAAAVRAVGAALLANPIGATVAAIATAGLLLYQHWDSIAPLFRTVGDALQATGRFFATWGRTLGSVVMSGFRAVGSAIGGFFGWVATRLGFDPMPIIRAAWEPVTGFFTGLWGGIRDVVGSVVDWIEEKLGSFLGKLEAVGDRVGAVLRAIREAWNALTGSGEGGAPSLPEKGQSSAVDPEGRGLAARAQERNQQSGLEPLPRGSRGVRPIEGWEEAAPPAPAPVAPQPVAPAAPVVREAAPAVGTTQRSAAPIVEDTWRGSLSNLGPPRPIGQAARPAPAVQARPIRSQPPIPPGASPEERLRATQAWMRSQSQAPQIVVPRGQTPRSVLPAQPAAPLPLPPPAPPPPPVPIVPPQQGAMVGGLDVLALGAARAGEAAAATAEQFAALSERVRAAGPLPAAPAAPVAETAAAPSGAPLVVSMPPPVVTPAAPVLVPPAPAPVVSTLLQPTTNITLTQTPGPAGPQGPAGEGIAGARAMGGPISAGAPYLVGERGPEIVVPTRSGTVIPNHAISRAPPVVFRPVVEVEATVPAAGQQSFTIPQVALASDGAAAVFAPVFQPSFEPAIHVQLAVPAAPAPPPSGAGAAATGPSAQPAPVINLPPTAAPIVRAAFQPVIDVGVTVPAPAAPATAPAPAAGPAVAVEAPRPPAPPVFAPVFRPSFEPTVNVHLPEGDGLTGGGGGGGMAPVVSVAAPAISLPAAVAPVVAPAAPQTAAGPSFIPISAPAAALPAAPPIPGVLRASALPGPAPSEATAPLRTAAGPGAPPSLPSAPPTTIEPVVGATVIREQREASAQRAAMPSPVVQAAAGADRPAAAAPNAPQDPMGATLTSATEAPTASVRAAPITSGWRGMALPRAAMGSNVIPMPGLGGGWRRGGAGAPAAGMGARAAGMPRLGGAMPDPSALRAGEDPSANPRAQEAMRFFQERGWSKEQAAGLVGNLIAESNLSTTAVGDGGKARGIAQWHPDRQENFRKFAGKDLSQATYQEQLAFVHHELSAGREQKAGAILRNANTPSEAATVVDQFYERSAGFHRGRRIALAARLSAGQAPAVGDAAGAAAMPEAVAMPSVPMGDATGTMPAPASAVTPAMLPPVSAPEPSAATSGGASIGAALAAGEDEGGDSSDGGLQGATRVGRTQEPPNANDNDAGGAGGAKAVGETARGGISAAGIASGSETTRGVSGEYTQGAQATTINAPITINISGVGAMDPNAVAALARAEVEKGIRRATDQVRRGMYD